MTGTTTIACRINNLDLHGIRPITQPRQISINAPDTTGIRCRGKAQPTHGNANRSIHLRGRTTKGNWPAHFKRIHNVISYYRT
ncbi:hypothetical protein D3C81_1643380 [compost metagenome]